MDRTNNHLRRFGPFRLEATERRLLKQGEPVLLTRKAFDLLVLLAGEPGCLKTRDELISALWPKTTVGEHGLTTTVHALRKALGDEEVPPQYIETVRGVGYRFIAAVTTEDRDGASPMPAPDRPSRHRGKTLATAALAALIVIAAIGVAWRSVVSAMPATKPSRPGITVLPFENASTDPANAYFTNAVHDEILTRLVAAGAMNVISHRSTKSYRTDARIIRATARRAGATAVVVGSVQKIGDTARVNVRLIDTRTGTHIWARTYTRSLSDPFGAESEIANKVETAIDSAFNGVAANPEMDNRSPQTRKRIRRDVSSLLPAPTNQAPETAPLSQRR